MQISNGVAIDVANALKTVQQEYGACDHSVNICYCSFNALVKDYLTEIKDPEQMKRNKEEERMIQHQIEVEEHNELLNQETEGNCGC